jgi:Protein of unknown function (DUF2505)
MRFTLEDDLAAALERVEAALLNPAFFERLGELPNLAAPVLLDETESDGVVSRRVRYQFTGDVPGAVRRFVDTDDLTWVDEWTYHRAMHRAVHTIVPDRHEGMLRCSYEERLEVYGDGCRRSAEGMLSIRVPIVGGRAERAIVGGLRDRATAEAEVLAAMATDTIP